MKVKLLSYTKDPEQVVAAAIRQCYAAVGSSELKKKIDKATRERMIKQVMASGHTSTLEHASFTFGIEGISRACSHQLVRHRIASFSQQSQRYVNEAKNNFEYVMPPKIKAIKNANTEFLKTMKNLRKVYEDLIEMGVPAEDARFVLPNAAATKIVVTMNARALLHFLELRCCKRAQWEIQQMANLMLTEVKKVAPIIFEKAGPSCITQKICWEGEKMTCGLYKTIKGGEVRSRV
jgi:thymidylate synthase (FAD)